MPDRFTPVNHIQHYNKRLESLKTERSTFLNLYRELSDYIMGYRGRFTTTDRNRGHKRNTKQINDTAARARRTMGAGMLAGMSSPSRPWFRLGIADRDLRESLPVKIWLKDVEDLLYEIFSESNFYNSMAQVMLELGTFGTAVMGIFHDFGNVIRCRTYTVGSYMLSNDGKGIMDTFYREYQLRVSQVIKEFGFANASLAVQNNWTNGTTEAWIDIVHVIEPNDNQDMMSPLAINMPFRSVYYEKGTPGQKGGDDKFLRQSGFEEFPMMTPRWDVTDEDVYATDCPGMTAIGGAKALQVQEKKKAQAIDKLVDPPLQVPIEMRGRRTSLIPGDVNYVDVTNPGQGIKPVYEIKPEILALLEDIRAIQFRVNAAFFVDLFLMFANIENRERVTAEEIVEKKGEKLLMLGPMLERAQHELYDPLIDRTFNIAQRADILPEPPPEIENLPIQVEYISTLFSAQKAVATAGIERLYQFAGSIAQIKPEAMDKLDGDQSIDEYGEALGVPPTIVLSDDDVEDLRAERRRQEMMQRAAAMAVPGTEAIKNLSESDTSGKNALTDSIANIQQR